MPDHTEPRLIWVLRRWGAWILLAFAFCYYGYYYRNWPGPGGEGGLVALVALRLFHGQLPIVDTFLGYNVLWFYPVVWIFKLFGPNYVALRVFFFMLCTVTGLMSFRLVRVCTGMIVPAFLAGLLVLVIPGQIYRNYMAFLVVLNMTTFLAAYVLPAPSDGRRLLRMAAAGITLGIAYLVRVDVGFLLTFVLMGLILIFPIGKRVNSPASRRIALAAAGLVLTVFGFLVTHLPFYIDARQRGFAPQFSAQYGQWPRMIGSYGGQMMRATGATLSKALVRNIPSSPKPELSSAAAARPDLSPPPSATKITKASHERRSLTSPIPRDRMLALNLYLPIPVALLLAVGAAIAWIRAFFRDREEARERSLTMLTCLGCSLVLFPQYFFWQPNMVHLSEFMVPMTVTLIISLALLGVAWRGVGNFFRAALGFYLLLTLLTLILYYINACQSGGSGGIASSQHKSMEFHAANGVSVMMTPGEFEEDHAIHRIVTAVSLPGEFVVCYPYHPEINFMTDRPSYEYNLYADNDIPPERFYRETVENISRHHPAAFVINNWAINDTEESRFQNWAAKSYRYIAGCYVLAYRHGDYEIFVRPDRADLIPSP